MSAEKAEKPDVYDCLAAELVKLREESLRPESVPGLTVERTNDGRLSDPYRFLTDRANALLPNKVGISPPRLRIYCRSAFFIPVGIVLFLGILISPLSRVNLILSSEWVNLAGPYFFFLALQMIFLSISLVFLPITLLTLLWSAIFPRKRGKKQSGTARRLASFSGLLGGAALWIYRRLRDCCSHLFRRKKTSATQEADGFQPLETGALGEYLDQLLDRQNSFLFFGSMLSHLFWFSLSSAMLLILVGRMQGNLYNYCWNSSLLGRRQVEKLVERIGRPIRFFAETPSGPEIDWIFHNSTPTVSASVQPTAPHLENDPAESSEMRVKWSWFLLTVVFFYAVLPRCLLASIYFILFRRSLTDFRPDLADPYYTEILEREKTDSNRGASETVLDEYPADEPFDPGPKRADPPAEAIPSAADVPQRPAADLTLALGFDAEMADAQWRSILGDGKNVQIFGNITRTRETQKKFVRTLAERAEQVQRCVVLIDVGFPPAKQTRLFLQNELFGPLARADGLVILSCGERLRKKFESRTEAIAERFNDWADIFRQMAEFLERKIETVDYYDHQLNLPEPRERLRRLLCGKNSESARTDPPGAIKFGKAKKIILDAAAPFYSWKEAVSDEKLNERLDRATLDGYNRLLELYREENRSLTASVRETAGRLFSGLGSGLPEGARNEPEEIAERLKLPPISPNRILEFVPELDLIKRARTFCGRLSPKTAIAFGTIGLALPLASIAAPLAAGGITVTAAISALGGLGTLLPASLASGLTASALGSVAPMALTKLWRRAAERFPFGQSDSETAGADGEKDDLPRLTDAAELVIRTLTAWGGVLELQSFRADEIAERLPVMLAPLEEADFSSGESAAAALDRVEERLEEEREQSE